MSVKINDQIQQFQQCAANKNKIDKIRCPNKCKSNIQFCGKHASNGLHNLFILINDNNNITVNNNTNTTVNNNTNTTVNNNNNTNTNDNNIKNKIIGLSDNDDIDNIQISKSQANKSPYKATLFKQLEKTSEYNEYLSLRKNYIKDSPKFITLVDYIENDKLESYPTSRICATLDHYNILANTGLGTGNSRHGESSKFIIAMENIGKLQIFFDMLLKATENLSNVIKIQRFIRNGLIRLNTKLRGPALEKRDLCVNDIDFYSLDPIIEIENQEFFSFKDESGFIYGFHIESLIELIIKSDENYYEGFKKNHANICYRQFIRCIYNHYNKIKIINPYTRNLLNSDIKHNIIHIMAQRLYKNKKLGINNQQNANVDFKTSVRNKCFAVFQKIDMQGYYTDMNWLYEERQHVLKLFYKKLALLWTIEFGLTETARYKIVRCNYLFNNLNDIMISKQDKYHLLDKILDVVNKLVDSGETESDKQSGCIIVLYALASINQACIRANPWLG